MTLHPLIIHRLSGVRTPNEATAVWFDHSDELEGYLFVLSQPGEPSANWPAKLDLAGGGFLRSVFAHNQLLFTSHEILADMVGEKQQAYVTLDYTIGFDSNIGQYLCNLVEGRSSAVVDNVRQMLRELARRRFNWEVMPILMEHSEAILAGRDLDHVWRVVHASEYLSACDLRHFANNGELRLLKDAEAVATDARNALSEWHRVLVAGEIDRIRQGHALYHALLLKIALLWRARPSPRDTARNAEEFLEFMCGTLGISLPWMLWAAAGLFEHGGAFEPLRKLTGAPDHLIRNSRNIAWDVMHYTERRRLAGMNGQDNAFLLPYTLTFDRGLAQWLAQQAQRSCLLSPEHSMPQFFAEFEIQNELLDRFGSEPAFAKTAARHFTHEAHLARAAARQSSPKDLIPLALELETQFNSTLRASPQP